MSSAPFTYETLQGVPISRIQIALLDRETPCRLLLEILVTTVYIDGGKFV